MAHHAYVLTGEGGAEAAKEHAARELGLSGENNPDIITLSYGLLSVEEARKIITIASQAPVGGAVKAVVITAARLYHEAQNALLKLFEEPPTGTTLYLIVPSIGVLLPTLRSRVQVVREARKAGEVSEVAEQFIKMSKEKRSAYIKKLATGKDEDDRREHCDEALAVVSGIEALAYAKWREEPDPDLTLLLRELSQLREYLHERSAPLRMILEHVSLVLPKGLAK